MKRVLVVIGVALAAAPAAAYVPGLTRVDGVVTPTRWAPSSFPIVWRMNPEKGDNVTGGREQAAVFREAFQEWDNIATAAVSFEEGSPADVKPELDGKNLITTNLTPEDFGANAVGLAIIYRSEATIFETDILFDPETEWSTSETTPSDRLDLESVAVHEIGHLLGLDHTNLLSSTMFPSVVAGSSHGRMTRTDDRIGVSTLYPGAGFTSSFGAMTGTVRTTGNDAVFGAMVVAIDSDGNAVASALTAPDGTFTIPGLPPGTYTIYAEPMKQPFTPSNVDLEEGFPGEIVNTNFTVRYR